MRPGRVRDLEPFINGHNRRVRLLSFASEAAYRSISDRRRKVPSGSIICGECQEYMLQEWTLRSWGFNLVRLVSTKSSPQVDLRYWCATLALLDLF